MTLREETDAVIRNSRRMVVLAVAGAVAIAPVISGCGAGEEPQSASPTQLTEGVNVSVPLDRPEAPQVVLRNVFLLGSQPGTPVAAGASLPLYGVLINQDKKQADRLVGVSSPLFGQAKIDGGGLALPQAAPDGTGAAVNLLGKPSATPSPTSTGTKKPRQPGGGEPTGAPTGSPQSTPPVEPTGPGSTSDPTSSPTSGNTAGPQQSPPAAPGGEQPLVVLPSLTQELQPGATVPVRMQFEKAGAVDFRVPVVPQQGEFGTFPAATPSVQPPTAPAPPNPTGTEQPGGEQPPASGEPGQTGSPTPPGTESPDSEGH